MQILAISDTHGHTDPEILELCKQADEVWHAGDIGPGVLETLEKNCKVLRVVRGNADPKQTAPDELEFQAGGLRVRLLHHFTPSNFMQGNLTGRNLDRNRPDVMVCGHTHILEIRRDAAGMLIINPGACGRYGILKARTVIRFEIMDGQIKRADVIELDAPATEQARDGYLTVKEFAAHSQRRLEAAEAMAVGKQLVAYCREAGLEIRKKAEGQFLVNSYPEAALRLAFEQFE